MYMENNILSNISSLTPVAARGFLPLYHQDVVNHCPACGHTHWHVGRAMAECAFCETALPLAAASAQPNQPLFRSRNSSTAMPARG